MNKKHYGKRCSCSHFESDHKATKAPATIDSVTKDFTYMIPPASFHPVLARGKCKVCDCIHFEPMKKKRWWLR